MSIFKRLKLRSLNKKVSRLARHRQSEQVDDHLIKKEIDLYYQIAALYDKYQCSKKWPYAKEYALENYRAASNLNDLKASYTVGYRLMYQGEFWFGFQKTHLADEAQSTYAQAFFDEAFRYLRAADERGYPLAKRLMGLAYVRGWGVEQDWEKGAELIKQSITLANGWENASVIFEELGINKEPDVLAKIMSGQQ